MYLRKEFDIPLSTIVVSIRQIAVTGRAAAYQRKKSVAI